MEIRLILTDDDGNILETYFTNVNDRYEAQNVADDLNYQEDRRSESWEVEDDNDA